MYKIVQVLSNSYLPPLLVIEVLSPSTQHRDWGIKKQLYEKFGIKEYWIINPSNMELSMFIMENQKYKVQNKINLSNSQIESIVVKGFKFGPISLEI